MKVYPWPRGREQVLYGDLCWSYDYEVESWMNALQKSIKSERREGKRIFTGFLCIPLLPHPFPRPRPLPRPRLLDPWVFVGFVRSVGGAMPRRKRGEAMLRRKVGPRIEEKCE